MKTTAIATGAMLLSALLVAQAAEPEKRDVVAFSASVRVDVDAAGKPVKVQAPADLPEAIRAYVEKRVASWQYLPARQGGVPAPATTYVRVGACALPDEASGGYLLGVDFKGNGPGIANDVGKLLPPEYPHVVQRHKVTGSFAVVLAIQADGSTKLDSITPVETNARAIDLKALELALRRWANNQRFDPESVAGIPVLTRMRVLVNFVLGGGSLDERIGEIREAARQSTECALAEGRGEGLQPVAIDSPIKVIPTPAG